MKKDEKLGKMVVRIRPVSRKQYNQIIGKVSVLAALHGLTYSAKWTPNGGKK